MRADGVSLVPGWGSRDDLEHSFRRLELIKAPQKMIIYTCARWQEALLEQLAGAMLHYPHRSEGECYTGVNLLGSESVVAAHAVRVGRSGARSLREVLFKPVTGSPFVWGEASTVTTT